MARPDNSLASRIIFSVYGLAIHVVCVVALPWLLFRAWKTGKLKEGFSERFGILRRPWLDEVAPGRPIWIHAVSVGEAQMLGPLLGALQKKYPEVPVVVSTATVPGQMIANTFCEISGTFFVPLDLGWAVRGLLRSLRPRILIIMETEIWPNLILQSARAGVPVVFLNGRISDHSYEGYLKARFFLSRVLENAVGLGMQSEKNKERIIQIGAPPEKVHVTGNLKYESAYQLLREDNPFSRAEFGLHPDELVLIGGSTFPGEEEMLIRVYEQLRSKHPNLRLMLAPRHPQRFEEVKEIVRKSPHPLVCRSQGTVPPTDQTPPPILVLDVMGELKKVYQLTDVVFIGKSMRFSQPGCGGQNPLEPAVWSKPILCGPSMENFQEVTDALREAGGIEIVKDESDLLNKLSYLLADESLRKKKGKAAFSIIGSSLGAVDRSIEMIESVLSET